MNKDSNLRATTMSHPCDPHNHDIVSSMDQRIQALVGCFREKFFQEISAQNLGPLFGGYGSFLPVENSVRKESDATIHCSNLDQSPAATDPAPSKSQNAHKVVNPASKSSSRKSNTRRLPDNNLPPGFTTSDHKGIIKKRSRIHKDKKPSKTAAVIRTGNEELYRSLGLEMSPSSSPEMESHESISRLSHVSRGRPVQYPDRIINLMRANPLSGRPLLSPLESKLSNLIEISRDPTSTWDRTNERAITNAQSHTRTDEEKEKLQLASIKENLSEEKVERKLKIKIKLSNPSTLKLEEKEEPELCSEKAGRRDRKTRNDTTRSAKHEEFAVRHDDVVIKNWVQCDKCDRWWVLPRWMDPSEFRRRQWTCSNITWLNPGMISCKTSKDDNTATVNRVHPVPPPGYTKSSSHRVKKRRKLVLNSPS